MAKEIIYKVVETFQIVTSDKITIEKGQVIPEDFFVKNFGNNAKKQIEILLNLKKIKIHSILLFYIVCLFTYHVPSMIHS